MYFILVLLLITVSVWVSARRRKREQEQALKVTGGIRQGTAGQADRAPEPGEAVFLYDIRGRDIKSSKGLPDPLPGRGKVHSGGCMESAWMVKGRIPG